MPRREPIAKVKLLTAAALDPARRSQLADQLYPLFLRHTTGFDFETFRDEMLFAPETERIALFKAASGEVVGYGAIKFYRDRIAGVTHHTMNVGLYIDLRFQAGERAGTMFIREALRYRLRRPRGPLWFVYEATSPAPYWSLARYARVYPHPDREPPSAVVAVVEALARRHQLSTVGSSPFVVRDGRAEGGGPRETDAWASSKRVKNDRLMRYYCRLNPDFATGALVLVCAPLSVDNSVRTAAAMTAARVRRAVGARARVQGVAS
jgi:hypothetical protein